MSQTLDLALINCVCLLTVRRNIAYFVPVYAFTNTARFQISDAYVIHTHFNLGVTLDKAGGFSKAHDLQSVLTGQCVKHRSVEHI